MNAGRAAETKSALARALLAAANNLGAGGGLLTHQMGSAQLPTGQRTLLHDLVVIAELDGEAAANFRRMAGGAVWQSVEPLNAVRETGLHVRWLLRPADRPSSLRVVMAGGKAGQAGYVRGALSWQPTLLLDDQMWFPYVHEVRGQRLHVAFGSWRDGMAAAAADARRSVDRRFGQAQSARHARKKQQAGNRQRCRQAEDRRADLLTVARGLWARVIADVSGRPGRPAYRSRLAELLQEQGVVPSDRDLKWLMRQLAPGAGRG